MLGFGWSARRRALIVLAVCMAFLLGAVSAAAESDESAAGKGTGNTGRLKYVGSDRPGTVAKTEVSQDGKQRYIYFGTYPQTEIVGQEEQSGVYGKTYMNSGLYEVDSEVYAKLTALPEGEWSEDATDSGKASWNSANDAVVDGVKYHRMQKSDAALTDGNFTWSDDIKWHYFRCDPIRWKVLNLSGRQVYLLADQVLNVSRYDDRTGESCLWWEETKIRKFFNEDFVQGAFTTDEQSQLIKANRGNGVLDLAYPLAQGDADNSSYFPSKADRGTTYTGYAIAMGLKAARGNARWWLRDSVTEVADGNYFMDYDNVKKMSDIINYLGVRPTIKLELAGSNDLLDLTEDNVQLTEETLQYDGTAKTVVVTVQEKPDETLSEKTDYTLEYKNNTDRGTATVTVCGTGNWEGSISKTFRIEYEPTCQGKIVKDGQTYDQVSLKQTYYPYRGKAIRPAVSVAGLTQGVDYDVSYADNDKLGVGTVTLTGIGEASGSISQTFVLENKVSLSDFPVSTNPQLMVYNGQALEPAVSVEGIDWPSESDDPTVDPQAQDPAPYTVRYENNVEPGTATVIVEANEEAGYTGETKGSFTILAEPLEIDSQKPYLDQTTFKYDGQAKEPKLEGLEEGRDYKIEYKDNTEEGTATATITGMGLYQGSTTLPFYIIKVDEPAAGQTLPAASLKVYYSVYGEASHGKVRLEYIDTKGEIQVRNVDGTEYNKIGRYPFYQDVAAGTKVRVTLFPEGADYAHYPWMSYTNDYKMTNYDEGIDSAILTLEEGQQINLGSQNSISNWFDPVSKFKYASYELNYAHPVPGQQVGDATSIYTRDGQEQTLAPTVDPEQIINPSFLILESEKSDPSEALRELFSEESAESKTSRLMGQADVYQNDKYYYFMAYPAKSGEGYITSYTHNGSDEWNTENFGIRLVSYQPLGQVDLEQTSYTYDGQPH